MSAIGCCLYCGRPSPVKAALVVARAGGRIFCTRICHQAYDSGLTAALEQAAMAAGE